MSSHSQRAAKNVLSDSWCVCSRLGCYVILCCVCYVMLCCWIKYSHANSRCFSVGISMHKAAGSCDRVPQPDGDAPGLCMHTLATAEWTLWALPSLTLSLELSIHMSHIACHKMVILFGMLLSYSGCFKYHFTKLWLQLLKLKPLGS